MQEHWNTTAMRTAASVVIVMQFRDSYHGFPQDGKYICTIDNLDLNPYVIVIDENGTIVAMCIFRLSVGENPPEIVVQALGTHPSYMTQGFGKTAVKTSLTYIQNHCPSGTFGLYVDLLLDDVSETAFMFWENL